MMSPTAAAAATSAPAPVAGDNPGGGGQDRERHVGDREHHGGGRDRGRHGGAMAARATRDRDGNGSDQPEAHQSDESASDPVG